jgi:hypothetical protein
MSSAGSRKRRRDGQGEASQLSTTSQPVLCNFELTETEKDAYFSRLQALQDEQALCDISFDVGGSTFPAHKSILLGHGGFLGALVRSGMKEMDQPMPQVGLHDADPRIFTIMLQYLYGKSVSVSPSDMVDLLGLATRFQITGLRDQVSSTLMQGLDNDNCTCILSAADMFACTELRAAAFSKVVSNFAKVCKAEGWTQLEERLLREILSSDLILDCDESIVFEAACSWLDAAEARSHLSTDIISLVRFPLMDAGLLSDVIKHHPAMQDPNRSALLTEAWEHQALMAAGRGGKMSPNARTRARKKSCSFRSHDVLREHSDAVSALTVVRGKLVSGSWDMTIKIWSLESRQCERTLSDHIRPILCFADLPDMLISGSEDATIKVWNPETWQVVRSLSDHSDSINALCSCGDRLASASDDGSIKLWNMNCWSCEVTLHPEEFPVGVMALTYMPQNGKLISGSDQAIRVWNTSNWTCESVMRDHSEGVWVLTSMNNYLVSGSVDCTLRIWNPSTWVCEKVLTEHTGAIYAVAIMDGKKLVTASNDDDNTLRVWNAEWQCERVLSCAGVWALATYTPEGEGAKSLLLSGSYDKTICIWD